MTGVAENKFGQVLICLRMSKLDYLVKETPYSASVTIRKKFVKSVKEETTVRGAPSIPEKVISDTDKKFELLKESMKDLETKYALLLCENEDLEVKCNQLENDKIVLEVTLEEAYGEARDLRKNFKDNTEENSSLKKLLLNTLS